MSQAIRKQCFPTLIPRGTIPDVQTPPAPAPPDEFSNPDSGSSQSTQGLNTSAQGTLAAHVFIAVLFVSLFILNSMASQATRSNHHVTMAEQFWSLNDPSTAMFHARHGTADLARHGT